jgi:hypothetical protein
MGGSAKRLIFTTVALLGLCQQCAAGDFFFQTPQRLSAGAHHPGALPSSRPTTPALAVATHRTLDLRPPELAPESRADSEVPFPARTLAREARDNDAPQFHFQGSKFKQMAEHFHREGLPVARLWETHSALLSLGLNSHGKPGLWLIQKTH